MLYDSVYGGLADGADDLTIEDARKDAEFWSAYCTFEHLAMIESDGTISYHTAVDRTLESAVKTMPGKATRLIATWSAFTFAQYYVICTKYGVEPFSDEANADTELLAEFQSLNYSGLKISTIGSSSKEIAALFSSDYRERCTSLKTYDYETLGQDVKDADGNGDIVIVMGSASINKTGNAKTVSTVENNGGYVLLNNCSSIPETFAMIEQIGIFLGYSDYIDDVIEGLELRLYKIYYSLQQHSEKKHKAYFEGTGGKAISGDSNGSLICNEFFGWNCSLNDGAEHDTEDLLQEKPDIILFYSNDSRSMDVRMRVSSA